MIQEYQSTIGELGAFWRLYRPKGMAKNMETLNNFVAPFIERAISISKSEIEEKQNKGERLNFIQSLSLFTHDKKVLRDQLVSTLLAGRDTTACAMSWLFYELACHPEVYDRLRREVLGTIGKHGKLTYEDLKGMRYLQHCINESMSPRLSLLTKHSGYIPSCHSMQGQRYEIQLCLAVVVHQVSKYQTLSKTILILAHSRCSRHVDKLFNSLYASAYGSFWSYSQ